jgi:hypothetical protein
MLIDATNDKAAAGREAFVATAEDRVQQMRKAI